MIYYNTNISDIASMQWSHIHIHWSDIVPMVPHSWIWYSPNTWTLELCIMMMISSDLDKLWNDIEEEEEEDEEEEQWNDKKKEE